MHWHPTPELLDRLDEHGFHLITLCRHPLSVLISILHFAPHHPDTVRWLEGEGGNESSILGVLPRSRAFLDWASGPRARALLSVTPEWWTRNDIIRVRYEALHQDPLAILEHFCPELHVKPVRPLDEAVEIYSLQRIRDVRNDHHAWKASPDLWKLMLPKREAEQIATAHGDIFKALDYECNADATLDDSQADLNWLNAEFASIWEQLDRARNRIAWLVEQQERQQRGLIGRLRKSLVERFPGLVGTLKRSLRTRNRRVT